MKKAHERIHHESSRTTPAFPAQWCYGLFRALPGERRLLPPSPARYLAAGLTPRSRRQDHTTSPYAANVSSGELCLSVILIGKRFALFRDHAASPDAAASIASQ